MDNNDLIVLGDTAGAGLVARYEVNDFVGVAGKFIVECRDAEGNFRWSDGFPNLVVTAGKNDLLNKYFLGSAYTATFYVGLKSTGTALAADTMASHTSWTEITGYSNATRPTFTAASSTAGSSTNSASPAVFNINATNTVAGCFITTNSTIGGTTGTLFSAADFATARAVLSGDTLTVTYTVSC